ncbi:hypothetical protein TNCV_697071 [Trichonephila clavipes]|nr:hypothetical protein TNCV_697071 [Trichonephila clavipes]
MLRVGKTRPLPGHSIFGSIGARKTLSWRASTHHGVQQGRQCAGHLAKPGTALTWTLTHNSSVSSGTPKRGTTSRLTGAGSLLPPVYNEAWAKGIPRTPFSSLRDAAHGKHADRYTRALWQRRKGESKMKIELLKAVDQKQKTKTEIFSDEWSRDLKSVQVQKQRSCRARDLDESPDPSMSKIVLRNLIISSKYYKEEEAKELLEVITAERLETEQQQKLEQQEQLSIENYAWK